MENDRVCGEHFHSGKAAPLWDKFNVDWVPSLNMGHQKSNINEASPQRSQDKAKRVAERRKRMHENTEEMVKEKLQRVNEPGVAVKCLFDPMTMDAEMDDIEDIAENLPENLRNAITQTEVSSTTVGIQTSESHKSHNSTVQFRQAKLNIPAFTKGKDQLDPADVEHTRKIATVRIHVERIIGLLRQKYTILQQTLPTDYLFAEKENLFLSLTE
jgi:hypothetical protein